MRAETIAGRRYLVANDVEIEQLIAGTESYGARCESGGIEAMFLESVVVVNEAAAVQLRALHAGA
jgi:hypothetical protein